MERRHFLKASALAGAASLSAPALAQTRASIRWRCASGFTEQLETLYGAAVTICDAVSAATDGRFVIEMVEPVGGATGLGPLDALSAGDVDLLHTAPHYFAERDPAFAFGSGLPFGLNQRLTDAWLTEGGGLDLLNRFLAGFNVVAIPAGNTGAQMGGWFNKEINTLDDLRGVRFRIGGFASEILRGFDVQPVALAPEQIVAAFEADEIDAAEFAGPADDVALGLQQVARYLYYPGWWEGGVSLMSMINRDSFDALEPSDQAVIRHACALANVATMARYDSRNPPVLAELEAAGTIVRPYSYDILEACFVAAEQTYRDIAAGNAPFAEMLESYMEYRRAGYAWFRRSEYAYDTFLTMLERGGRL